MSRTSARVAAVTKAPRKPTRRDLLVVIGRLQEFVSSAKGFHGNDRDPNGFEKGQDSLDDAFDLCIAVLGTEPQITKNFGPWGGSES